MTNLFEILAGGRASLTSLNAWRRRIQTRDGIDDARRAQAKRLLVQQHCTNPMFTGYPYGDVSSPKPGSKLSTE